VVTVVSGDMGCGSASPRASSAPPPFHLFQLPPVGTFSISDSRNWVALVDVHRRRGAPRALRGSERGARSREAEDRRREADLAAEMARLLLRGDDLARRCPRRQPAIAQALELGSAAIEMDAVEGDARRVAFPLREGTTAAGHPCS